MKIAFFCATPYQILLATNIKYSMHLEDDADIYVLNHFADASLIAQNLKKIGLFENVKLIDSIGFSKLFSKYKVIRYYQKISIYFQYRKIANQYFNFEACVYDEIYLTYPDVIIQLGMRELYDRNFNIKVHMYEDGLGGYSSNILKTTLYKKCFNLLTGFGKVIDRYDDLLMFMPELYSGDTSILRKKIPTINQKDVKLKKMVNAIFDYKEDLKINERIIFFEQPINHIKGLNQKIKDITDEILVGNYIIKLHPRTKSENYKHLNTYQNKAMPWEIICFNNDIEDKILISYYSTAGITSKSLFDKEPIIILLFEMEELKEMYLLPEDQKEFIFRFKKTYRDPSKVFIPKNLRDLKQYLYEINQKLF